MSSILVWIIVLIIYVPGVVVAFGMVEERWSMGNTLTEAADAIYVFCFLSWITVLWIKFVLDPGHAKRQGMR